MKIHLILCILIMEINLSVNKAPTRYCYQAEKNPSKAGSPKRRVARSLSRYGNGLPVGLNIKHQGVCSTWGNFHFKTFDGELFHFPGLCNYLFAAHCRKGYEDFNIQIQQSLVNSLPMITQISLKVSGLVLELINYEPTIHGTQLKLPYNQNGLQIEKSDNELKIIVKLVLVLVWHDDNSVQLTLNKKYMGETCGLCADYNGDQSDDFIFNDKKLNPFEFGNLQKLRKPETTCVDPKRKQEEHCTIYRALCFKLLRSSKWARCNRLVNAEPYIEAYMKDMCLCKSSLQLSSFCLCKTITEYSRQCALAGGKPPNWRNPELCYKECPLNFIYSECSSPCVPTCSNPQQQLFCEGTCVAGCVCPRGYVKDDITNAGCVPVKNCSCIYNKDVYAPGESYQAPCYKCLCSGGYWQCEDLPCPSTCSVEGGSHIITFDKAHYTFHGQCLYVLTKSCADNAFLVTVEMQKCAYSETATCLTRVLLFLDNEKYIFEINYNSKFPEVTYNENIMSKAGVHIFWPSSFFLIVHTNKGLYLQVQLTPIMQLFVILDPSYKKKTCGLCGNFNNIQKDDFRSTSGAIEGNVVEFANSWKTQYSCRNVKFVPEHPCTFGMEIEKYAHHWCNVLIDSEGPFAVCHALVNPELYQQKCLFDTCSCKRAEDCLCASLSSYSWACAAAGIPLIGWREDVCRNYLNFCPQSFVYSYNVTTCIPTCRSLTEPDPTCSFKFFTVDGCVCPPNTYINDIGVCVRKEDCQCYYKGVPVSAGKPLHVGRSICTCTKAELHCVQKEIPVCVPPMTYFDCEKAGPNAKGSECPQTCQTSNTQCYSTLCVSGCVCPKGLVLGDNGTCIEEEKCPCFHNGISYKPGETVTFHCDQCVCKNQAWVCDSKADMGICTVYGEGHYITFDSKRYTINGDCTYTLVQDYCHVHDFKKGTFRVTIDTIPCGTTGTSCSKAITVFLGTHKIILADGQLEVLKRSSEIEIPYQVRTMGIYLVIESSNGLVLVWDRATSIFIHLNTDFKGTVCGLCGNFDGDSNNDFTTRSHCVVEDVKEFRDSWKLSKECPEVYITKEPCVANPYRVPWAQKRCSIINSEVFSKCHSEVDPEIYYEACVSDTCACDVGGDCNCFCTAVAAYAKACSEACVCIDWRTPHVCPLFCDFYNKEGQCQWHYMPCGAPCMKTCRNPNGTCLHHLKGLEGCYPQCPADKPFFNEDEMICVSQCGCLDDDGNYYRIGEKVESCNSCETCVCTVSGIVCHYDFSACYCEFLGQIMDIGEIIQTEDSLQNCIIVKCGLNGTVVSMCPPTKEPLTTRRVVTISTVRTVPTSTGKSTKSTISRIETSKESKSTTGASSLSTIILRPTSFSTTTGPLKLLTTTPASVISHVTSMVSQATLPELSSPTMRPLEGSTTLETTLKVKAPTTVFSSTESRPFKTSATSSTTLKILGSSTETQGMSKSTVGASSISTSTLRPTSLLYTTTESLKLLSTTNPLVGSYVPSMPPQLSTIFATKPKASATATGILEMSKSPAGGSSISTTSLIPSTLSTASTTLKVKAPTTELLQVSETASVMSTTSTTVLKPTSSSASTTPPLEGSTTPSTTPKVSATTTTEILEISKSPAAGSSISTTSLIPSTHSTSPTRYTEVSVATTTPSKFSSTTMRPSKGSTVGTTLKVIAPTMEIPELLKTPPGMSTTSNTVLTPTNFTVSTTQPIKVSTTTLTTSVFSSTQSEHFKASTTPATTLNLLATSTRTSKVSKLTTGASSLSTIISRPTSLSTTTGPLKLPTTTAATVMSHVTSMASQASTPSAITSKVSATTTGVLEIVKSPAAGSSILTTSLIPGTHLTSSTTSMAVSVPTTTSKGSFTSTRLSESSPILETTLTVKAPTMELPEVSKIPPVMSSTSTTVLTPTHSSASTTGPLEGSTTTSTTSVFSSTQSEPFKASTTPATTLNILATSTGTSNVSKSPASSLSTIISKTTSLSTTTGPLKLLTTTAAAVISHVTSMASQASTPSAITSKVSATTTGVLEILKSTAAGSSISTTSLIPGTHSTESTTSIAVSVPTTTSKVSIISMRPSEGSTTLKTTLKVKAPTTEHPEVLKSPPVMSTTSTTILTPTHSLASTTGPIEGSTATSTTSVFSSTQSRPFKTSATSSTTLKILGSSTRTPGMSKSTVGASSISTSTLRPTSLLYTTTESQKLLSTTNPLVDSYVPSIPPQLSSVFTTPPKVSVTATGILEIVKSPAAGSSILTTSLIPGTHLISSTTSMAVSVPTTTSKESFTSTRLSESSPILETTLTVKAPTMELPEVSKIPPVMSSTSTTVLTPTHSSASTTGPLEGSTTTSTTSVFSSTQSEPFKASTTPATTLNILATSTGTSNVSKSPASSLSTIISKTTSLSTTTGPLKLLTTTAAAVISHVTSMASQASTPSAITSKVSATTTGVLEILKSTAAGSSISTTSLIPGTHSTESTTSIAVSVPTTTSKVSIISMRPSEGSTTLKTTLKVKAPTTEHPEVLKSPPVMSTTSTTILTPTHSLASTTGPIEGSTATSTTSVFSSTQSRPFKTSATSSTTLKILGSSTRTPGMSKSTVGASSISTSTLRPTSLLYTTTESQKLLSTTNPLVDSYVPSIPPQLSSVFTTPPKVSVTATGILEIVKSPAAGSSILTTSLIPGTHLISSTTSMAVSVPTTTSKESFTSTRLSESSPILETTLTVKAPTMELPEVSKIPPVMSSTSTTVLTPTHSSASTTGPLEGSTTTSTTSVFSSTQSEPFKASTTPATTLNILATSTGTSNVSKSPASSLSTIISKTTSLSTTTGPLKLLTTTAAAVISHVTSMASQASTPSAITSKVSATTTGVLEILKSTAAGSSISTTSLIPGTHSTESTTSIAVSVPTTTSKVSIISMRPSEGSTTLKTTLKVKAPTTEHPEILKSPPVMSTTSTTILTPTHSLASTTGPIEGSTATSTTSVFSSTQSRPFKTSATSSTTLKILGSSTRTPGMSKSTVGASSISTSTLRPTSLLYTTTESQKLLSTTNPLVDSYVPSMPPQLSSVFTTTPKVSVTATEILEMSKSPAGGSSISTTSLIPSTHSTASTTLKVKAPTTELPKVSETASVMSTTSITVTTPTSISVSPTQSFEGSTTTSPTPKVSATTAKILEISKSPAPGSSISTTSLIPSTHSTSYTRYTEVSVATTPSKFSSTTMRPSNGSTIGRTLKVMASTMEIPELLKTPPVISTTSTTVLTPTNFTVLTTQPIKVSTTTLTTSVFSSTESEPLKASTTPASTLNILAMSAGTSISTITSRPTSLPTNTGPWKLLTTTAATVMSHVTSMASQASTPSAITSKVSATTTGVLEIVKSSAAGSSILTTSLIPGTHLTAPTTAPTTTVLLELSTTATTPTSVSSLKSETSKYSTEPTLNISTTSYGVSQISKTPRGVSLFPSTVPRSSKVSTTTGPLEGSAKPLPTRRDEGHWFTFFTEQETSISSSSISHSTEIPSTTKPSSTESLEIPKPGNVTLYPHLIRSDLVKTIPPPQAQKNHFYSKCLNATCLSNGDLDVNILPCPKVQNIHCEDRRKPIKIYDQDGCCFHYECKTCIGLNGIKRRPGETWIEHCKTCTCNEDSMEISCEPVKCMEPNQHTCDKPWLKPFVTLTEFDLCCPRIECQCTPSKCSNLEPDCPLGYKAFLVIGDSDCCPSFDCKPMDVCVYEGILYEVGTFIWTEKTSCKTCQCSEEKDVKTGLNIVSCEVVKCVTNCPLGFVYQKPDDDCCGQCAQVSCVAKANDGTLQLLQHGESKYLADDNCTMYTCEAINRQFQLTAVKKICPEFHEEECESGILMKTPDGCCNVCQAAKSCRIQEKISLISYKGCGANFSLPYCEGSCSSSRKFSVNTLAVEGTCVCCNELETDQQEIKLTCPNGEGDISFNITVIKKCGCVNRVCNA